LELLRDVPSPPASQSISAPGQKRRPLPRQGFIGGDLVTLGNVPGLQASRIRLESKRQSPLGKSEAQALVLFASRGDACLLLGTEAELAREDPPSLELPRGTVAMIPPGMAYQIAAPLGEVEISLHSIRPEVALSF